MKLQLILREKNVSLVLLDGDEGIDEKRWIDENNLLEKFFPNLDKLLSKNGCYIDEIDDFILETNIPEGYTTARIAQTIVKTFNFAYKNRCDII